MNNLMWLCVGIALTVPFPELTQYAQEFMKDIVTYIAQK
jgi:hypothetical protein|tara:strand:+ start:57 stop:173 length:117 start_codon:yes stop_codon:yes gene_type:complete